MRARSARAFLPVAVLVVGGCGSSILSSKQLRSNATQICQNANHRATRIAVPASPPQAQAFLARGIATLAPELNQLKQLRPNSTEAPAFHTAVNAFSEQLIDLRKTQQRLRRGADPVSEVQALERQLEPLRSEGDRGWRELGISACVSR